MILSDLSIRCAIDTGAIQLRPAFREAHLRPAGIRVHLSPHIIVPVPGQTIKLSEPADLEYTEHNLEIAPLTLKPHDFVLASTVESVRTSPDLLCILEGRSTIARLGLSIHNTASFLDGSFNTWLTPVLEIANHGTFNISLEAGVPIGMLTFQRLSCANSLETINPQYLGQSTTTGANLLQSAGIDWVGAVHLPTKHQVA